jgi:hypothetical protein
MFSGDAEPLFPVNHVIIKGNNQAYTYSALSCQWGFFDTGFQ